MQKVTACVNITGVSQGKTRRLGEKGCECYAVASQTEAWPKDAFRRSFCDDGEN